LRSRGTGSGKEKMMLKFVVAWRIGGHADSTVIVAADAARAIAAAAEEIPEVLRDLLPEGTWVDGARVGRGEEPAPGENGWSTEIPGKGLGISVERVAPEGIPLSFPPGEYGNLPAMLRGILRVFPDAEVTGNPEGGSPWRLVLGRGRSGPVFSDIPLLKTYVESGPVFSDIPLLKTYVEGVYDALSWTRLI
jgi:hypothetical protein